MPTQVNSPSSHHAALIAQRAVYVLLALAMFRFWVAPLGSSFWLDETGTFWTIKDGLGPMFVRVREWSSVSAVYGVVCWAAYALGGAREYVMRLPSFIAISLATLLIYRLARRLLCAVSALPAVAVFICSQTVVFAACDARPYALLLLAVAGSTLSLVCWLETNATQHAITYVISVALALHTHYLAFPLLAAHAAYALARLHEGSPVPQKWLLIGSAAIGILLAPLAPVYLSLFENRRVYSLGDRPGVFELALALAPPVVVFAGAIGLMLAKVACGRLAASSVEVRQSTFVLLVALAFGPVFLFFAISVLTSARIFVPRYMIESQVALALLAGWAISRLRPKMARSIVTGTILACSIGAFGSVGHLWPVHGHQDWRGAMAEVRRVPGITGVPVIVQSGFDQSWLLDRGADAPPYLMAPLILYPSGGRVIPIPRDPDQRSRLYAERSVVPAIERGDRFVLVTGGSENPWKTWLEGRFPGWTVQYLGNFDGVSVTLFRSGSSHRP